MTAHWQNILEKLWGVSAKLSALDGEYDLNFLASGANSYVLKVMRAGCDEAFVDLQCKAFGHIRANAPDVPVPAVVNTIAGKPFVFTPDEAGTPRVAWLLEKVEGITYARFKPHSGDLIRDVGAQLGSMDKALVDFTHPQLHREFKWDLTKAEWIANHLDVITDPVRRAIIREILSDFGEVKPTLDTLPRTAIHNDVNDYNIIVSGSLSNAPKVTGLIDLGDICDGPRVCDLAIAAAYIALNNPDPEKALVALVSGYHEFNPLTASEIDLIWPLLRARLAVSVVNSTIMAAKDPNDPYILISQKPAWTFLEGNLVNAGLINARLRTACGLPITDAAPRIMAWLDEQRGSFAPLMGQDLSHAPLGSLSVESSTWPQNPFDLPLSEASIIGREFDEQGRIWLGYYGEPRLIYTATAFRKGPWKASNRRTVHLAVDAFAPHGTSLQAPLEGTVHAVDSRGDHLDYGGLVILRHETPGRDVFYTLYGHLNAEVCETLSVGQFIAKGDTFARLGDVSQSGGWSPHVHFQLALTIDGMGEDWPGVADPDDLFLWREICPNPAALINVADDKTLFQSVAKKDVLADRKAHFSDNLKLSYDDPIMLLRGWRHHLFDEWGRPYLDAYNNVPHVGHAHPRIQSVASDQLRRMNSNTRYLHPAQTAFATKILSKMPDSLDICFFVNSGTEANELALRLARAHTGGKDMITPEHGYHGNTTGAIDISAYKFNANGGVGQPDWVHLIEVADDYRGSFRRDDPDRAVKFAALTEGALTSVRVRRGKLAGF
ncbi:MAG: aminotransferase class III-fold pyridoxal phosphate-dependent enzyme, partial [Sulfitobacter sp.]